MDLQVLEESEVQLALIASLTQMPSVQIWTLQARLFLHMTNYHRQAVQESGKLKGRHWEHRLNPMEQNDGQ
jgi:hypothetical protein